MSSTGTCSYCRLPIERASQYPNSYYYLFPEPHQLPDDPGRICPGSNRLFLEVVETLGHQPEHAVDDPMRFG